MAELEQIHIGNPSDRKPNIVFLHGLDGHYRKTWMADSQDPSTLWPKWIGEETGCDVSLLRYGAALSRWKADSMALPRQATAVLECLSTSSFLTGRPLILIGHSLGGLIIKAALRQGIERNVDRHQRLVKNVKAIAFIGTPHFGSKLASIASLLRILRANPQVSDLRMDDANLEELNYSFARLQQELSIRVRVYSESQPVRLPWWLGGRLLPGLTIVSPSSSHVHIPGEVTIPVEANHITICKPKNRTSAIHLSLLDFLAGLQFEDQASTKVSQSTRQPSPFGPEDGAPYRLPEQREKFGTANSIATPIEGKANPSKLGRILFGREDELSTIRELIAAGQQIIVLVGISGIGKTVLAEEAANRALRAGKHSKLAWIGGRGRAMLDAGSVIDEIALCLDFPFIARLDSHLKEQALIQVLRSTPVFVVVDELEILSQAARQELLSLFERLPSGSCFLITSQIAIGDLALTRGRSTMLKLSGLSSNDASKLVETEFSRLGVQTPPLSSEQILALRDAVDGSPLGIKLTVARLQTDPGCFEETLTVANKGNSPFTFLFERAWNNLSDAAKRLLMATIGFQADFSREAWLTVSGIDADQFNAIHEVLESFLVEPRNTLLGANWRYKIHPLVLAFASSRAQTAQLTEKIFRSSAAFFLDFVQHHEVRFWEGREAYSNLETERNNILYLMEWAHRINDAKVLVSLVRHLTDFLIVRGDWRNCILYGEYAISAAETLEDSVSEAWLLVHSQGYILVNTGDVRRGSIALRRAIKIYRRIGEYGGLCEAARNLGRAFRKRGRVDRARKLYSMSLSLAQSLSDKKLIALTLNEIGKLDRDQKLFAAAISMFNDALLVVGDEDSSIRAGILCNLSGVYSSVGNIPQAIECAEESLRFFAGIDNLEGEATVSARLAEAIINTDPIRARALAANANTGYMKLGMQAEAMRIQGVLKGV